MSPAQEEALDRCGEIMREHFEAAVLVVSCDNPDDDETDHIQTIYNGGFAACVGLSALAGEQIREDAEEDD